MALPLNTPEVSDELELERLEVGLLLDGIAKRYGYDFRDYAQAPLLRCLQRLMRKEGIPSVSALQDVVLRDPAFLRRLVEAVSTRTRNLFDDPPFFRALRQEVVPLLRTFPSVRVWQVGCGGGEDAYALAILLREEKLAERSRIYVTDISEASLERARRGVFRAKAVAAQAKAYRDTSGTEDLLSFFQPDGARQRLVVAEPVRRQMVFAEHNLACDGPFNEFQLIVARDLGTQLDEKLRQRAHGLFEDSLCLSGVLCLGREESPAPAISGAYRELSPGGVGLYGKVR